MFHVKRQTSGARAYAVERSRLRRPGFAQRFAGSARIAYARDVVAPVEATTVRSGLGPPARHRWHEATKGQVRSTTAAIVSPDSGQLTVKPATSAWARENRQSPTHAMGR